jgi:hypothetical protein
MTQIRKPIARPPPTYLEFQTPHYKFQMVVNRTLEPFHQFHFLVGDSLKPCLEGVIQLETSINNDRYKQHEYTGKLLKIDALEECSVEDITSDYTTKYSFGKEMLDAILFFINSQFIEIKTMSLNDTSYIPCNRDSEDTLDLLSYSIALYKKSWYEEKLNAYLLPKEKHDNYRTQVEIYASKDTKQNISFNEFYHIILSNKPYPTNIISDNLEKYKEMYESSETLPEFFIELSKSLRREQKCKFFKDWLFNFISSKIQIERMWYFDLFPKIKLINQTNMKPIKHRTRRNKNSNK